MKVYMVELRTVAAVSAEDETAAYLIAQRKQREILNDTEPDITVQTQAKSLADLTDGWTPDARRRTGTRQIRAPDPSHRGITSHTQLRSLARTQRKRNRNRNRIPVSGVWLTQNSHPQPPILFSFFHDFVF